MSDILRVELTVHPDGDIPDVNPVALFDAIVKNFKSAMEATLQSAGVSADYLHVDVHLARHREYQSSPDRDKSETEFTTAFKTMVDLKVPDAAPPTESDDKTGYAWRERPRFEN